MIRTLKLRISFLRFASHDLASDLADQLAAFRNLQENYLIGLFSFLYHMYYVTAETKKFKLYQLNFKEDTCDNS